MKRRRLLLGMCTAAAGGSALLGSGSFSDVASQRTVEVEVVGDDNAYLTLQYSDISFECSEEVTVVTITNHTLEEIDNIVVDISVTGTEITLSNPSVSTEPLGIGDSATVTADAQADSGTQTTEAVTFDVETTGLESSIEAIDRSVDITADCP